MNDLPGKRDAAGDRIGTLYELGNRAQELLNIFSGTRLRFEKRQDALTIDEFEKRESERSRSAPGISDSQFVGIVSVDAR